jgi:hypothetical protein
MTITPDADVPPETERTVAQARGCVVCGATLTGRRRQAQHCSDRCRTEGSRLAHQRRIAARLDAIVEEVKALRRELRLQEPVATAAPVSGAIKWEETF